MKKLLLLGLVMAIAAPASATVIVDEDFEAYADTAAMQVNWGATGLGTLDAALGNPGQSAYHPGGTVNSWIGSPISLIPAAGNWVVLSGDIYDDASSANKRMSVGLRNGATPLFEMGLYNAVIGEQYNVRVLNMYGNEGWKAIMPSAPVAGWHHFEAVFTESKLTVTLDLGSDGTIDGTFESFGAPAATAFVDLRFGGPSNLSSAGGGFNVDNIRLETIVPEPASLALLALGGLIVARRRR